MKICELLNQKAKSFSFEFFPPKEEKTFNGFLKNLTNFANLSPTFVSVTYGAGGSTKDKTFNLVKYIHENFSFPVMAHLTCLTHTFNEISNILNAYTSIGVENILALRGDVPKDKLGNFDITKADFKNALELTLFITKNYNSEICIATAVYPEGHPQFRNIDIEIDYLRSKFEAGASFGITQMFFDNSYFYNFMEKIRKKGINNIIIPGIMPITNYTQTANFAKSCGAEIPSKITELFEKIKGNEEDTLKLGIEIALSQIENLFSNGFHHIHLYTLNRYKLTEEIVGNIKTLV